eukprot:CAMPEP_0181168682 /NCGR_PEP_ID=MMETSP1096-20121128/405_1 /TAXON_ID=156174 ORGANISM="Chrysochromulina ericina, Strain CCMP281" /NCGR_SAMPLE_ID=MMETSP1096 /ASSEMBLY_ACC=CAM_ASM_000453 /LENGTH=53 /DNA_ID=CAMNT_0023256077 /DNA_START=556 /DNA_END=714 /DNA_ORIENTATION=-
MLERRYRFDQWVPSTLWFGVGLGFDALHHQQVLGGASQPRMARSVRVGGRQKK